jgi:hypothetical protein
LAETNEPVILVTVNAEARAYPLQILTWHEIVNDTVGDLPLVVTFCRCATLQLPLSAWSTARCSVSAPPAVCDTAT